MRGKGFIGDGIQLACLSIAFKGGVESRRIEHLEPGPEPAEFGWRKLLNCFLDFFCSRQLAYITPAFWSRKHTFATYLRSRRSCSLSRVSSSSF